MKWNLGRLLPAIRPAYSLRAQQADINNAAVEKETAGHQQCHSDVTGVTRLLLYAPPVNQSNDLILLAV